MVAVVTAAPRSVEGQFCELVEARSARDVATHASYAKVPRFWAAGSLTARAPHSRLRALAEARRAAEREEALTWVEGGVRARLAALGEARLDYGEYQALFFGGGGGDSGEASSSSSSSAAHDDDPRRSLRWELSARRFLELGKDDRGRVSSRELAQHLERATSMAQVRRSMRRYDAQRRGSLREVELERYVYDLIAQMGPLAASMDEKFHAFYVFTAVRRFMFFLDPRRRGRIPIEALASSALAAELHSLVVVHHTHQLTSLSGDDQVVAITSTWVPTNTPPPPPPPPPPRTTSLFGAATTGGVARGGPAAPLLKAPLLSPTSWFLPDAAKRVYSDYLQLDGDHNGMLSKAELLNFKGSASAVRGGGDAKLTQAFVDRVFAEILTYRTNEATGEGEMDFKTYLDLVLAFENMDSRQALAYFWRLLDIRKAGVLDAFAINYFFREIADHIRDEGYDAPTTADVIDEIFDMVKPANPRHVTADDLHRSGVAKTVIAMLIDVNGFLTYDNREHLMQGATDDDNF